MMPLLLRTFKRFLLLISGALIVYLAVWRVFPFFDHRVPVALALFLTYVAMAYLVIPALFRGIRLFYRPQHIPLYCTTPDGFASDPINIGLIGTRRQVIQAMEAAGWHMADGRSLLNVARQVAATLLDRPYPTAPVSRLYLFGRHHDLAFELEITDGRGMRHHVRFWGSQVETPDAFIQAARFWQRFYRPHRNTITRQLWVGAASKDVGFAPIRHNAQLTHMIDPDTNSERELITHDLQAINKVANVKTIAIHKPYSVQNRAWRGYLTSDGKLTICELVA